METKEANESQASRTAVIGRSLLKFAEEGDFSARRGVVADLYPYIMAASKRMSARAISRYLEKDHEVKISAVTIAKAIRNPSKYWMQFFDAIEPCARRVSEAHNVSIDSLLFGKEVFEHFCHTESEPKYIQGCTDEDREAELEEFAQAVDFLEAKWFSLDEALLKTARYYLQAEIKKSEAEVTAQEEKSA
jgi:hypothetical protein